MSGLVVPPAAGESYGSPRTCPKLLKAIEESRIRLEAMTDAEKEAMYQAQKESYVRAESGPDW